MNLPELGWLEDANVSEAWSNEPRLFTPWLSQNLSRLGRSIGSLQLELIKVEQPVGPYSLDIFARSLPDGRLVVIENQLTPSDHRHLGQILTYLSGLKADIVIWVAPKFTDEHLSAVRWLNENFIAADQEKTFAFFALQLRVVRIGNSPFAPLFEVLEGPNNWDRTGHDLVVRTGEATPSSLRRRAFWERYRSCFNDAAQDERSGGGASLWRYIPDTRLVVSQYITSAGVGLFVRGHQGVANEAVIARLLPLREELEERLDARLEQKYPLSKMREGDVADDGEFKKQAEWLHEQLLIYVNVISDVASRLTDEVTA